MKIIRARDCRTTPWKNGGGSTTEIAVEPSGASLDTFAWRISVARVAADGPFSEFPGIDRTLAVLAQQIGAFQIVNLRHFFRLQCGERLA